VKQKASEIAAEKARDAADLGEKVADAVAEEARKQGLTTDRLKSAAGEIPEKLSRVAEAFELSNPPR
jgi:hypothetical protein